jgi:hypothetical protein
MKFELRWYFRNISGTIPFVGRHCAEYYAYDMRKVFEIMSSSMYSIWGTTVSDSDGNIISRRWSENGERVPEKKKITVWVNMYQEENMVTASGTYDSLDAAVKGRDISGWDYRKYIGTHAIQLEIEV